MSFDTIIIMRNMTSIIITIETNRHLVRVLLSANRYLANVVFKNKEKLELLDVLHPAIKAAFY